jgi:hypothetical protein
VVPVPVSLSTAWHYREDGLYALDPEGIAKVDPRALAVRWRLGRVQVQAWLRERKLPEGSRIDPSCLRCFTQDELLLPFTGGVVLRVSLADGSIAGVRRGAPLVGLAATPGRAFLLEADALEACAGSLPGLRSR